MLGKDWLGGTGVGMVRLGDLGRGMVDMGTADVTWQIVNQNWRNMIDKLICRSPVSNKQKGES